MSMYLYTVQQLGESDAHVVWMKSWTQAREMA